MPLVISKKHTLIEKISHEKALGEFFRFALIGVINTLIDFGILNLLLYFYHVAPAETLKYTLLKSISFIAAVTNSFLFNKYWVFKHSDSSNNKKEVGSFLMISIAGLLVNDIIASLVFSVGTNIDTFSSTVWANIGALTGVAVVFITNFLGYKYLVFNPKKS
jgi:putative flippase GtrA